jgi:hypothetical protein
LRGEPDFAAIGAWNAAGVYQKAIALMGAADRWRGVRGFPARSTRRQLVQSSFFACQYVAGSNRRRARVSFRR